MLGLPGIGYFYLRLSNPNPLDSDSATRKIFKTSSVGFVISKVLGCEPKETYRYFSRLHLPRLICLANTSSRDIRTADREKAILPKEA